LGNEARAALLANVGCCLARVDNGGEVVSDRAKNIGMRLIERHSILNALVHLDDICSSEDKFGDRELQTDDVLDVVEILVNFGE
jgi:hypothetical protein